MADARLAIKTEIAVIGAGQAGLSAAYHLRKLGLRAAELRPLEKVALTQIDDYRKRASGTKQN